MPAKTKSTANPSPTSPAKKTAVNRYSAFTELGFQSTIEALCQEVRELYVADEVPMIHYRLAA